MERKKTNELNDEVSKLIKKTENHVRTKTNRNRAQSLHTKHDPAIASGHRC